MSEYQGMRNLFEGCFWWAYAMAAEHGMPVTLLEELRLTRAMIPALRAWARTVGIDADYIGEPVLYYERDWVVPLAFKGKP